MTDIREFNDLDYERVTKRLTHKQSIAKARRVRQIKGVLAQIDTYKGGYAVWIHDKRKARTRKPAKSRLAIPYSCPECGAEIGRTKDYEVHSDARIECLECGEIFKVKKKRAARMKPLNIKLKKARFKPLSSRPKAFAALDRENKRNKIWGPRLNLIKATAKWRVPSGERYEAEILFQYYNDYFEEGLEGKEAISNSAYQVMFAVKIQGSWTGTNTIHVDPKYSSAHGDYKNAITVLKTVHRISRDEDSSSVYEFLYRHFAELYGENEWDKFGH